jgi:alpha-galactosidase
LKLTTLIALTAMALNALALPAYARRPATSPPMGWNSWDAYGLTIDEKEYEANATVLADLSRFGWKYAIIDEGWYMADPFAEGLDARKYQLDDHGLLIPSAERFPSSKGGAGFKPLADWTHARGLRIGVHIVRGIPKEAVRNNVAIAGTDFHAADAADTSDTCPWDDGNYGVRDNPAGQAYYNSMFQVYARWGIDFVKVDCIADHPYRESEIRQIAAAIRKTGRPIVLSLSPGPTDLSHSREVSRDSQMWRISNDIWDGWSFTYKKPTDNFPAGVITAFENLAKWAPYAGAGHWPDADMLPFGSLAPHPGWGNARQSRLTPDEERTQFTLWAVARSPLILGAQLTSLDDFTHSLITNRALIEVNQTASNSHPVDNLPTGFEHARVWVARHDNVPGKPRYTAAIFNLDDVPAKLVATWAQLGISAGRYEAQNLFDGQRVKDSHGIDLVLPAHGSVVFGLRQPWSETARAGSSGHAE